MTIPKSYEALAADLASEKILSKTLLGQKEAYMMLADKVRLDLATWKQKACEAAEREAALRESLTDKREDYNKLGDRYDALQQRLTVAEQRAAVMEKAISRIAREHDCGCSPCTGSCTSQVALEITVDAMRDIAIAALKPAEGEVS